jgi:hypothetical protein
MCVCVANLQMYMVEIHLGWVYMFYFSDFSLDTGNTLQFN